MGIINIVSQRQKWMQKRLNTKYNWILLLSYVIIFMTLILDPFFTLYWQIARYFAVMSCFSILFVSGYWILCFSKPDGNNEQNNDLNLGKDLFNISVILATGLTISSFIVIISILLIGYFPTELFYLFLLTVSSLYSTLLLNLKWKNILNHGNNFKWTRISYYKELELLNPDKIIVLIATIMWFGVSLGDTDKVPQTFSYNILIQIAAFFLLFIATLYSISQKRSKMTLVSIFLIFLFTRISIYQNEIIVGVDSATHYVRFLQILETPKLLFEMTPINLFAPITYSWMIFLNTYGSSYILPFSFILVSCSAYMCIFALGIKLTSFRTASIGVLFIAIELTTFQFGFEIRTFIIALIYIALLVHSLFEFKETKKHQLLHILLLILIGLSHITSFVIIMLIEGCLSGFYLIEKLIDNFVPGIISLMKSPLITKSFIFLIPIVLLLVLVFSEFNYSIKWLINVFLNKNPMYYISFDISRLPGFLSLHYGFVGVIIIWLSRISLLVAWLFALIFHFRETKEMKKSSKLIIQNSLFRILLYITFSLGLIILITAFIPTILSPSRIYVFLVIPMGFLLGLSEEKLGKRANYFITVILLLFFLNTLVRYPFFLDLILGNS